MTIVEDPAGMLLALLEAERAALLAGRLGELAALLPAKMAALEELERETGPEPSAARRIAVAARRNERLLAAALRGVDAARERLQTARRGGPLLSTYTATGRAESFGGAGPGVERRI